MSSELFELSALDMTASSLEEAARYYAAYGVLVIRDIGPSLVSLFEGIMTGVLADLGIDIADVYNGAVSFAAFSPEARKMVSQVRTTPEFSRRLLTILEPLLLRILGPVVHVSRDFHAHFKGSVFPQTETGYGGYPSGTQYLEPFSRFLLHQDFTGANLPTSPSFPTVWVPLTTGPDWGLRLYPGSHRRGLLCNQFVEFENPRLEILGKPVDFTPERGSALLFHALVLHGTTEPGPSLRVSCDARFFPLSPFLGSTPWLLGTDPLADLEPVDGDDEILRVARLETQAVLGRHLDLDGVPTLSILHWAKYLEAVCHEDDAAALKHLERLVNPELTGEGWEVYRDKYHGRTLDRGPRDSALKALSASNATQHPRLAA